MTGTGIVKAELTPCLLPNKIVLMCCVLSPGNRSKALRLLQKGRDVDAQPGELLDSAVRSLKAGQAGLEHPQSSIGDGERLSLQIHSLAMDNSVYSHRPNRV